MECHEFWYPKCHGVIIAEDINKAIDIAYKESIDIYFKHPKEREGLTIDFYKYRFSDRHATFGFKGPFYNHAKGPFAAQVSIELEEIWDIEKWWEEEWNIPRPRKFYS